jgi:hypothetical protein
MGMFQSYEKPPPRFLVARRVAIGLAVAAAIYVFSFAAFVIRGHNEDGSSGWYFNYMGRDAWTTSPGKERFLATTYGPLYRLSRWCGIRIVHVGVPLNSKKAGQ